MVLSFVNQENVDYTQPFTKACQTALSTERVAHFFDTIRMQPPSTATRNTTSSSRPTTPPFTTVRRRVHTLASSGCTTMPLLRTVTTPSIMHEMDDHCLRESDNIDTQRLSFNVNLRVVSTVCQRDMTVTHLMHKKTERR